MLKLFSETKKGRTHLEFTPLSLIPERLSCRNNRFRSRCPIGGRSISSAALQSSLHKRSFYLSVSGWIAPSAVGVIASAPLMRRFFVTPTLSSLRANYSARNAQTASSINGALCTSAGRESRSLAWNSICHRWGDKTRIRFLFIFTFLASNQV